jgi:exodeoxyribonuclease V beta subunit
VHHVLEIMQTGGDVAAELHRCSTEALAYRPLAGVAATQLASALQPAVMTPLGPLADNLTLWQIGRRLTELDFELPLALHGGGRAAASPPGGRYPRADTLDPGAADRPKPAAGVTMAELAELMRQHLPAGDPFVEYPDRLEADGITATRLLGYLAGSIDAVLRVGDPERPRFLVVDYKTNWLGPADTGELTAASYAPVAMAAEMLHAHYPLQALLYCVALHRYLRWRLPGYEPVAHFGGVQYLFVRGMCGPQTPVAGDGTPYGVFSWQPGAALVSALSDRLKGPGS